MPSADRAYASRPPRSRSPLPPRRRSRSPSLYRNEPYGRTRTPRRLSPVRGDRPRSPPSRRSRSPPYGENRSQDAPLGPRRNLRGPSPDEDVRSFRREGYASYPSNRYPRPLSPSRRADTYHRGSFRHGSPPREGRYPGSTARRRSPSVSRSAASAHTSAPGSDPNSRISSPHVHPDRANVTPFGASSRSPANESLPQRPPSAQDASLPYYERKRFNPDITPQNGRGDDGRTPISGKRDLESGDRSAPRFAGDSDQLNVAHPPGDIPSQPRSYSIPQRHLPTPGGPYGPGPSSSQRRGPSLSLLSAPTGPRGSGLRDHPLGGTPGRRLPPSVPHGPPLGPRSNSIQTGSGSELPQRPSLRPSATMSSFDSRTQKPTNHLAGLSTIVPAGRPIPSPLDIATTKRLSQLDADRERLFEQVAESQKLKRVVAMDWDKLDRESSISDLKSELAEGHLQYITDGESMHTRVIF